MIGTLSSDCATPQHLTATSAHYSLNNKFKKSHYFAIAAEIFLLILGIGISNVYVASSDILAKHFIKYKHLAFSLAASGHYIGIIVFPILSQHLLDTYGYSMAMGILAPVQLIHIFAGIFFYEPTSTIDTQCKIFLYSKGAATQAI